MGGTLIVGSIAMSVIEFREDEPGLLNRAPGDLDVFSDELRFDNQKGLDPFWDESFEDWIGGQFRVATLDELYTIKVSHSYWELKNGSWDKHVGDMMRLKRFGAVLDPELHKLLYKVWEKRFGRKVMDLNQDKTEFFSDAVRRKYDHDSLHASVAYGDRPIYEEILKDGATVDVDPRKLWAMPHNRIVDLFTEEICVTALERIVIPRNYRCSPGAAYKWALRRTLTSLTKGRSARFIATHFEEFAEPDPDYVQRHLARSDRLIEL